VRVNRSEAFAGELERVNAELVEYLWGLEGDQWLTTGVNSPIMRMGDEDENRPVGTIAHHVAGGYRRSNDALHAAVAGEPLRPPGSGDTAREAAEHAVPDQAATIQLLMASAGELAGTIRGLTDEQLDREVRSFLGTTTLGDLIKRAVLFHPRWHLTSIQATFQPAQRS
jgi:hypothetical protein